VKKSILIFSISKLEDMKKKGNMSYIKHYEVFFDEVHMVYLFGKSSPVKSGKTEFRSLGSNNSILDLALAPIRLYRFVKKVNPQIIVTADLLFSWWSSLLTRMLFRSKILLIPVAMPHVIYESSGNTLTGILPRVIEKLLIRMSFCSANKVVTAKNIHKYVNWLKNIPHVERKLLTVDVLVDSLPSYEFYESLSSSNHADRNRSAILYVGRLHKEKLVGDIIESFNILSKKNNELELWLVGDGDEKDNLQNTCKKYNIEQRVKFFGSKNSKELVNYYREATVFVSTLTGTALREAGLSSTPVVCYEMDWVQGTFTHKGELLFAEKNNPADLASKIDEILCDDKLCSSIVEQMDAYANKHWSIQSIRNSLESIYIDLSGSQCV